MLNSEMLTVTTCAGDMQRQNQRGNQKDYFEKEAQIFYQKLIEGYQLSAKTFPQRIKRIDGTQSLDHVSNSIQQAANEILGL
mgnify:CR=1 FL=1